MKRSLALLPILFMLTGCGRMYTLIGRIVLLNSPQSYITEVVGNSIPSVGIPIPGATVGVFYELDDKDSPRRDSVWSTSTTSGKDGTFEIHDYAAPSKQSLVGLEVSAKGYETVYTTYIDYAEPDAQYFLVILRRKV